MKKIGKTKNKNRKINSNKVYFIALRYIILLGLVFSLPVIYMIFTPLTVYPVFFPLKMIYPGAELDYNLGVSNALIIIDSITKIEIVSACVAGAAYLLLLILNLSIPMNIRKRILSIFISFLILLAFNIIRIFIFSVMYSSSSPFFDFTHKLFWLGISTLFVVGIWFFIVKIFYIKEIPIYSDFQTFYKEIKQKE